MDSETTVSQEGIESSEKQKGKAEDSNQLGSILICDQDGQENERAQPPMQLTHPAVVAVCNVLMFDAPTEAKNWHLLVEHQRTRDTMEQCISHLILQRRPGAGKEWVERLSDISKKIEKNLYFAAQSIEE